MSPIVYLLYKLFGIIGSYIFLAVAFVIILIVLANLSFKNVVTYMCDKIDNSDNTKNSKKKKPFSGATINIKSKDNELPDIEFISDSFEKSF